MPQAYFSRHALTGAKALAPVLRVYQVLLYPIAKPTALLLDLWLGKERIQFFPEDEMREVIRQHMVADASDIDMVEGRGTLCGAGPLHPSVYCHRPIIVREQHTPLGDVLLRLTVRPAHAHDDVIDEDIILVWDDPKRVITGADSLGRLLRGIVRHDSPRAR